MMLVILTGIYGISVYASLPRDLSDNSAEFTRPQMIDAVQKIDRQLQIAAQPLGVADTAIVRRSMDDNPFRGGVFRRLSGHHPRCSTARAVVELRRRQATATGEQEDALDAVIRLLERKSAALGRIREHMRVRAMLEVWLYIHVPVTFALIAALGAHIVSVFFYW
jgi:hypothetical protein